MHVLNDLCYLLEDEVEQVVKKGELTPTELDNVYKAVKTMNYIETIKAMKDYNSPEYSNRGGRMYDGNSYGRNYERSYAYEGRYNDSSRNYARHSKEEKIAELERMMENASTEAERRSLMEAIRSMEK